MKLDTTKQGWEKIFKLYQSTALEVVFNEGEQTSGTTWERVIEILGKGAISRASIIFFLNDMVDLGILQFYERSGKGGFHRVYSPAISKEELNAFIVKVFIEQLEKVIPETLEIIKSL